MLDDFQTWWISFPSSIIKFPVRVSSPWVGRALIKKFPCWIREKVKSTGCKCSFSKTRNLFAAPIHFPIWSVWFNIWFQIVRSRNWNEQSENVELSIGVIYANKSADKLSFAWTKVNKLMFLQPFVLTQTKGSTPKESRHGFWHESNNRKSKLLGFETDKIRALFRWVIRRIQRTVALLYVVKPNIRW